MSDSGISVADLLRKGPLDPARALRIAAAAADALDEAHARGVLHRNLSPNALLLAPGDRPSLAGFAPAPDEDAPGPVAPGHRSPEQLFASPEEVDARTDVYSLASVLYEMLTGRAPFDDPDPFLALRRLELEDPAPPGISKDVDAAVLRALAKDPSARYPAARDFAAALRAAAPRPRLGPLPIALAAASAALLLGILAARPAPPPAPPLRAPLDPDPRLPWLWDAPDDPEDLFPAVRELAARVALGDALATDPARACGEILERLGPTLHARPSSPGPYALLGAAHLVHGNRALARELLAQARARLLPGADPGGDPIGALLAADSEERFRIACDRFLGGIRGSP